MDGASTARPAHRIDPHRRRPARRIAPTLGIVGVGAAVLALVVGTAFGGSPARLADGTTIAGVDVGGLTLEEARAELTRRAEAVERVPVRFTAGGGVWELAASQLGVRIDWSGAIDSAQAASDGFRPVRGFRRLRTRILGAEVEPAVSTFESVVGYTIRDIARQVDRPAVEPSLRRSGLGVELVDGRPGVRLDRPAATAALVGALASLDRTAEVVLPVRNEDVQLTADDLQPAAESVRTALAGPITLTAGETRWRIPRWEIARIVALPRGGATEARVAGKGADRWIASLQARVNRQPRDATFRVRPGGIEVVAAVPGRALDVGAAVEAIERAVFSSDRRAVALPVRVALPERSTAEARGMGITGVVGSYTTTYGGSEGRLANVALVAELIDGALIEPGTTFSFNGTTGERNAEKGFREAPVIINGELQNGIGGGVCQVSTTVFNAAFEAGLPIGSRTNHALYISHYPLGRDATVNYPDIDLTFSNDTGRWLLLRTFVGAGSLTVNLYGTPQGRRVETETSPLVVTGRTPIERTRDPDLEVGRRVIEEFGTPSRETRVVRRVYAPDGELLHESTWASYYRAEPRLVRVGAKPKPAPEPEQGAGSKKAAADTPAAAAEPVSAEPAAPALP